jgi:hypothetical protein
VASQETRTDKGEPDRGPQNVLPHESLRRVGSIKIVARTSIAPRS